MSRDTDIMRQWMKEARRSFRGDGSEWARAWRRALSQMEMVTEAIDADKPRAEIMRIGD